MPRPGDRQIGPDHRVVIIAIHDDGWVIEHQDQWTEVQVRDYRVSAPSGKFRTDRTGSQYRDTIFPATSDSHPTTTPEQEKENHHHA